MGLRFQSGTSGFCLESLSLSQHHVTRRGSILDTLVPRINPALLSLLLTYLPFSIFYKTENSPAARSSWHNDLAALNKQGKGVVWSRIWKKTVRGQLEPPPVPICGRESRSVQYPAGGQLLQLCPQVNDRTAPGSWPHGFQWVSQLWQGQRRSYTTFAV